MTPEHEHPLDLDDRMRAAVAELRGLIQQQYPTATFGLSRGPDDPTAIHLRATVDVDDPDDVVDLIIDRMMALQIEEDLPIFVIPVRTPERVEALRRVQAATAPAWRRQSPAFHRERPLP